MKGGTLILLLLFCGLAGIAGISATAWWYLRGSDHSMPANIGQEELEAASHHANEVDVERVRRAVASTGLIAMDIERFRAGMGRYPIDLNELITPPSQTDTGSHWDGPYINNRELLVDPWDHPLRYVCPGVHNPKTYDLWTVGFDGMDGTSDDVGNW